MNENSKKKEDNDKDFKDYELDLIRMEEDIINEGLDLVEAALSLVDSEQFDEGIPLLRQAIGLYRQIGRTNEINALRRKISEIYILKEQSVEEIEVKTEEVQEEAKILEDIKKDKVKKESFIDLIHLPEKLIEEAEKLIDLKEFEEALNFYDKAIKKYREVNNNSEIEKVYELIEKCYDAKVRFLTHPKNGVLKAGIESEAIKVKKETTSAEIERKQKLKLYEERKAKETKISDQGYEILKKAAELAKIHDFDKASKLYNKALNLFKVINWKREIQEIQNTIAYLKKEKEKVLKELEIKKEKDKKEIDLEQGKVIVIDETAKHRTEFIEIEKFKRLTEIEKKKQEEEEFHKQIADLVDEAESLNLNYEQEKKKAIKEKRFIELEAPFLEIIEIYKKIKNMLLKRQWTDQAQIYNEQIKLYEEKLEKDKKLRELEAKKVYKQKEYEKFIKVKKEDVPLKVNIDKLKVVEEKVEEEDFETMISKMVDKAIKMAREYEFGIRKGLKSENPNIYWEIIEIFKEIRKMFLEKGQKEQADIYTKQIQLYKKKLNSIIN